MQERMTLAEAKQAIAEALKCKPKDVRVDRYKDDVRTRSGRWVATAEVVGRRFFVRVDFPSNRNDILWLLIAGVKAVAKAAKALSK